MNAAERARLDEERRSLSFDPCAEPHRLRDKDERAPRSAERILAKLTGGDQEREARCWAETSLATLRARGANSGLCAFLNEVTVHVLALDRPPR